ncbi:MAG: hypothetical protein LC118_09375 [Dehalococcoidia bacterium]|nr:hypothetical protein [Dehalococcoidia bacterium]
MNERDPEIARRYGQVMVLAAAAGAAVYLLALARRSYWAAALPAAMVTIGGLGAVGVLGRLLATTPDEPPSPGV